MQWTTNGHKSDPSYGDVLAETDPLIAGDVKIQFVLTLDTFEHSVDLTIVDEFLEIRASHGIHFKAYRPVISPVMIVAVAAGEMVQLVSRGGTGDVQGILFYSSTW
jgi:hypothetical protein